MWTDQNIEPLCLYQLLCCSGGFICSFVHVAHDNVVESHQHTNTLIHTTLPDNHSFMCWLQPELYIAGKNEIVIHVFAGHFSWAPRNYIASFEKPLVKPMHTVSRAALATISVTSIHPVYTTRDIKCDGN